MLDSELEKIREKKMMDLKRSMISKSDTQGDPKDLVIELSSENFESILANNEWIIIDCWAVWCNPCKIMAPVFEKLAKEFKHKVRFVKLNTDLNPQIAFKYEIMAIPTFLLIHKGNLVKKVMGAVGEPGLRKLLELVK